MKPIHAAVKAGCVALIVTSSSIAIWAGEAGQTGIESAQPPNTPDALSWPKPVRTIPLWPSEMAREFMEAETSRVIAEQKRVDAERTRTAVELKRAAAEFKRTVAELKRIGSAHPPSAATKGKPSPRACIGDDYMEGAKVEPREAACLAELRKSAIRKGDFLALLLENGAVKTYQSANVNSCEGYPCARYWLVGYHPTAQLYMILAGYYEGMGSELVSARTGKVLSLPDVPHFSPDGSTFVAFDNDVGYGGHYDIVIGSTATDPPTVVWRQFHGNLPLEWDFQHWIDSDGISLRVFRSGVSRKCLDDEGCDAMVVRSGGSWTVQRPAWSQK